MSAITDGIGPILAPTQTVGRWASPFPSPSAGRTDRSEPAVPAGGDDPGHLGDLRRLYEARGQSATEAVHVRQIDRKLSRVADRAGEARGRLDQVKFYPPYPADEPVRAKAIREFNGIAQEVRRMVGNGEAPAVELHALRPGATSVEIEQAASSMGEVQHRFEAERARLAQGASSGPGTDVEASSQGVGSALGEADGAGLSRRAADLLRQIA